MKALVVDDSRAIRAVLSRYLKELGLEVVEAGDYDAALAALAAHSDVKVVLLDWNLPGRSGFEILCAIRAEAKFADVPVIMCTTETEASQMTKALEAGADEYVMKPFSRLVIMEKLGLVGISRES
jgi:two-component system chemotaxis response regulator CheY